MSSHNHQQPASTPHTTDTTSHGLTVPTNIQASIPMRPTVFTKLQNDVATSLNNSLSLAPQASTPEALNFYKDSSKIPQGAGKLASRSFSDASLVSNSSHGSGAAPTAALSPNSIASSPTMRKNSVQDLVAKFDHSVGDGSNTSSSRLVPKSATPTVGGGEGLPHDPMRLTKQRSPHRQRQPSATRSRRPSGQGQGLTVVSEAANSINGTTNGTPQHHVVLNEQLTTTPQQQQKEHKRNRAFQQPLFGEVESAGSSTNGLGYGISQDTSSQHGLNMTNQQFSTHPSASTHQHRHHQHHNHRHERKQSRSEADDSSSYRARKDASSLSEQDQLDGAALRPITPTNQISNHSYDSPAQQSTNSPKRLRAMVMAPLPKVSPPLRSSRPRQHVSSARSTSPPRNETDSYSPETMSPSRKPYANVRDMDMPTRRDSIRKALRAHSSQLSFDERAGPQVFGQPLNEATVEPAASRQPETNSVKPLSSPAEFAETQPDSPTLPLPTTSYSASGPQKLRIEVENVPRNAAGEAPMTTETEFEDESPVLGLPGAFPIAEDQEGDGSEPEASRKTPQLPPPLDVSTSETTPKLPAEQMPLSPGDVLSPSSTEATSLLNVVMDLRERDSMLSELARKIDSQTLGGDEAGTIQIMLSESPAVSQSQDWRHRELLHRPPPTRANELYPDTSTKRFSVRSDDSSATAHSYATSYRSGTLLRGSESYNLIHHILEEYRDSRSITDTMVSKFHDHLMQHDPELAQREDIDSQAIAKATLEGLVKDFGERDLVLLSDGGSEPLHTPHSLDDSYDPFMYGQPQAGTFLSTRKDSADTGAHGTFDAPRSKYFQEGAHSSPDLSRRPDWEHAELQPKHHMRVPQQHHNSDEQDSQHRSSGRSTPVSTASAKPRSSNKDLYGAIEMNRPGSSQSAEIRKQDLKTTSSSNLIFDQKPTLPEIKTAGSLDLSSGLRISSVSPYKGFEDHSVTTGPLSSAKRLDAALEKPRSQSSPEPTASTDDDSAFDPHPGQRIPTPEAAETPTTSASLAFTEPSFIHGSSISSNSRERQPSIVLDPAAEEKRLKSRRHAIKELIDTEFSYNQDMKVVEDIYKGTANAVDALTPEDRRVLFGNLSQLVEFTADFLANLKKSASSVYTMPRITKWRAKRGSTASQNGMAPDEQQQQNQSTFTDPCNEDGDRKTSIGACFGQHFARMEKVYGDYLKNHEYANTRLSKLQTVPQVKLWLNECHTYAVDITEAWDLDSLLVKPVQRIMKYPLILRGITDCTPKDHPDYSLLEFACREVANIASRINESKRRAELLDQVVNGTNLKKKEFDATLGLSRAFGRRTEKIRQQVGLSDTVDDADYKAIAEKFGGHYFQLQVAMRDLETYKRETSQFVKQYVTYMEAIEEIMDVGHSMNPELESKWRKAAQIVREMGAIAWPEHEASIQKHCIEPITTAIKLFDGPDKLMNKRKKRILEYAKYVTAKQKNEKVDKKLQEQGEQFLALNESLKDELPQLYSLSSSLVTHVLAVYVHLKVTWYTLWETKLKTIIDESKEPQSLTQVVETFKEEFSHTRDAVLALRICNGTALANYNHLIASATSDDWSNASTKRPSMQSTGNSSFSSMTDLTSSSRQRAAQLGSPRSSSDQQRYHGNGYMQPQSHQRSGSGTSGSSNLYVPHAAAHWSNVKSSSGQTPPRHGRSSHEYYNSAAITSTPSTNSYHHRTRAESYTNPSIPISQYYQQQLPLSQQSYSQSQSVPPSQLPSHSQQQRPTSSSTYFSATTSGPVWQPQVIPGGNSVSPASPEYRRNGNSAFSSALPMDDSLYESRRSSEPVESLASKNQDKILFLAASLFEFNIDRSRTEGGYPYLTYVPGEVFDVIGEKGELWLAKNQDDATNMVGWIWEKHFVKLVSDDT